MTDIKCSELTGKVVGISVAGSRVDTTSGELISACA